MNALGLKPTKNSGAGWIEKEDGQNDHVIAQLKSTDAQSIRLSLSDFNTLEYNAAVVHKIPMFVIQFLSNNNIYILIKPEDLPYINEYINTGEVSMPLPDVEISAIEESEVKPEKIIMSSGVRGRKTFYLEKELEKQKEKEKWKKRSK